MARMNVAAVVLACLIVLWALYRIGREDAALRDYAVCVLCFVGLCAVAALAAP